MTRVQSSLYNSLPTLEQAEELASNTHFDDLLRGPIRDVFLKHGCEKQFCIFLQHAHHQLQDGETIVKVAGTAHVMDDETVNEIKALGNQVVPSTWMSSNSSGFSPMELSVLDADDVASEPSDAFLEDLDSLLQDTDCHGSLGIDTVPQHDWAEFSIGEASVVVRSNNVPLTDFVPVAFVFDQDKAGYRVVKNCKKGIRHTSKKP